LPQGEQQLSLQLSARALVGEAKDAELFLYPGD
jgi:hypothetical protein